MTDYELLDVAWTENEDGEDCITVMDGDMVVLDLALVDALALATDLIAAAREAWMSGAA